jgi:ABC-type antimicrobial peptide transport system permease subunit
MLQGSKADLILSQPNSFDISYSSVDPDLEEPLLAMPEVARTKPMIQGFVQAEGLPFLFVFGHPPDSFVLDRFQIVEGESLAEATRTSAKGIPILLGAAASETLEKSLGETIRLGDSVYRIQGIYETGDPFEDSGVLLDLAEAQRLLGRPRVVSLYYLQLEDPALAGRLRARVEKRWPDLSLTTTEDFADKQIFADFMQGYVWAIAGLAILIGGVGMMNAQLMSVLERTREIGVLRSVGWGARRVLWLILLESILTGLLGGAMGVLLGWLALRALGGAAGILGSSGRISVGILGQAFVTVTLLGVVGGLYPAWRASRLQPIEAIRYEGGASGGRVRRLPVGGMAVQGLWQRTGRTALTLGAISLTVGTIMLLEAIVRGAFQSLAEIWGADFEVVVRQADIADSSLSAVDERTTGRLQAMPEVAHVSRMVLTALVMPEAGGFFIVEGYSPREAGIRRFNIVEGRSLTGNHQVLLGRWMSETLRKGVGDTIDLSGSRYRVVGIYESSAMWEEMGGIVTLRDGQNLAGRPRKSTLVSVKLNEASLARSFVEKVNQSMPEIHAALAGEFTEEMPDRENSERMLNGVSILAIAVGGVAVLNTMLMSVLERTREIGVLRALGWRRRRVVGLIVQESILLAQVGGTAGVGVALVLGSLIRALPMVGNTMAPDWAPMVFIRAFAVALLLGLIGGVYPAYRATRLQPVEALRYE